MNIITKTIEEIYKFELTSQQKDKVAYVAVTTLLLFGSAWAFAATTLTYYCEGKFRSGSDQAKKGWYNMEGIAFHKIVSVRAINSIGSLVITVALSILGLINFTGPAQVTISQEQEEATSKGKLIFFLFFSVILGPLLEEILFRGFLQERLEDLAEVFSRNVYKLSQSAKKEISNIAQATIFGLCHITGGQAAPGARVLVASVTGWAGYLYGRCKNENGSLVHSSINHSLHNLLASL